MNDLLDPLLLARWQFGLTTHLPLPVRPAHDRPRHDRAIFQTAWYRTGKTEYLHLTRFFGTIFLINFAMGVVTGIVQEFQFGMNWSEYSRFVGDVFGAPLAFEGLLAFFFEATFIGLWIFGWDKLPARPPPRDASGSPRSAASLSAYFIIAANAFMQNPVGYEMNADRGRAELVDFVGAAHEPGGPRGLPAHDLRRASWSTAGRDHQRRRPGTSRATSTSTRCGPPLKLRAVGRWSSRSAASRPSSATS